VLLYGRVAPPRLPTVGLPTVGVSDYGTDLLSAQRFTVNPCKAPAKWSVPLSSLGRVRAVLVIHHRPQEPRRRFDPHHLALVAGEHGIPRGPSPVALLRPQRQAPPRPRRMHPPATARPGSGDPRRPPRRPSATPDTIEWHPTTGRAAKTPASGRPFAPRPSKTPSPHPGRLPSRAGAESSRTTQAPVGIPSAPAPRDRGIPPDPSSNTSASWMHSSSAPNQARKLRSTQKVFLRTLPSLCAALKGGDGVTGFFIFRVA